MSSCPGCGWHHKPGRLDEALEAVGRQPETAAAFDDFTLTVLHNWTNGENPVISGEVKRRRDDYFALAQQFQIRRRR
jgi:hypothetical protein